MKQVSEPVTNGCFLDLGGGLAQVYKTTCSSRRIAATKQSWTFQKTATIASQGYASELSQPQMIIFTSAANPGMPKVTN